MINVLVFPCGSEIGLEIHRSLRYSTHVKLFGASSVNDHGRFAYENYISDVPFYDDPSFLENLNQIIRDYDIDIVYPAMDSIIAQIGELQGQIACKVIGSPQETNEVCLSKLRTYLKLKEVLLTPYVYDKLEDVKDFPVFMKPDIGYGSRGAKIINSLSEGKEHAKVYPDCIILENLPGKEYTVDCFTDKERNLLFAGARERKRIVNGISVSTEPVEGGKEFHSLARRINEKLWFRGAWFFQVKENTHGKLVLLEVASRLGGSSSLFRNIGVNFALMSLFDAFDVNVEVIKNKYAIEMDRSLSTRFKLDLEYEKVYVDFDDCILLSTILNTQLVSFLFQAVNHGKKLILITKHERDIHTTLKEMRISQLFDEIIHLSKTAEKWRYIQRERAIFIDDSFAERKMVSDKLKIPVFAPDAVESLII